MDGQSDELIIECLVKETTPLLKTQVTYSGNLCDAGIGTLQFTEINPYMGNIPRN